ncbi:MAG TPA: heme-binding protein [Planctomycetaceae bacterium]
MTLIRCLFLGALLVVMVGGHLSTSAEEKKPESGARRAEPLVTRGRVQLNLAGAEMIIAAAKMKGAAIGANMNIAVVDDGGHLLAFARMDGARPASGYTALTKAVTGATFRQETGPRPVTGEPDILLSLSLQNAALASGGKLTTLKGGVPIVVDGQVIGAVGVGGGTGEQDAEVAKAGIQAFQDALGKQTAAVDSGEKKADISIAERLKKKISVDFKREFLHKAIAFVSKETGVPIYINGQDLKMVGVTQNEYQNLKLDNVPATAVLQQMLIQLDLVLVVDEAKKLAIVTSRPAAENRGLKPLPLGDDNGK